MQLVSKIATPYNPNQGTNWLQNVFSPLTVREPYRLSLSKKTELWYGGGEEGTPWEDVNSRWPPHLLGETVGVLPHNRYPCPEAKQTGRWLQRRHSEDTGPFSSATHTATSFQPGVFYCWQMNPGPASVPTSPDVGQKNSLEPGGLNVLSIMATITMEHLT